LRKKKTVASTTARTLFDCLRKSEDELRATSTRAKDLAQQHTKDLDVLQAELDKLRAVFDSINATTSLDKM